MKIAFLQGSDQRERIFTNRHLEQLRQWGEVTLNERKGIQKEEQLANAIKDADVAITSWGVSALNHRVLDEAPNLKVVLHAAGTVKTIVTPELWARGIRVANAAAALGKGVAETALGMTIASLKDIWRLGRYTRKGQWGEVQNVKEMFDVKVGVVGAGMAGTHFIRLLQQFEVDILVYDPVLSAERVEAMGAVKVSFEELLEQSDVISIHVPSLPDTFRMFNENSFQLMKDDCILINTARGAVIDEPALVKELERGRFFACLDVTDPEPPTADHPFRNLPNVVLTPHIAGAVNNGLQRVARSVMHDLQFYMQGKVMKGEVKCEELNLLA
ncbi:hydroxyacid dehydrogenase [Paenibacillus sp. J5C_2022]|uniref:hydroxyacid dehydrogenase n=1 Tax=Paenibacillus sp. J5C2022 TaxID=2977129 RepID=UPI0021CE5C7F|nr:hydroxyacid dehydrogenase [Paenibacillus sp. J5C2022]MCU6708383.1 hydroxyacid dehydrogenase [Paenibacillus sp. J5C2022]